MSSPAWAFRCGCRGRRASWTRACSAPRRWASPPSFARRRVSPAAVPPPEEASRAMSTPDLVRVTVDAGVAVLTLDNPPLNVVTLELTRRLRSALDRLAADPEARVLIVTGAGSRAFCAGSDVREFPSVADDVVRKKLAPENDAYSRVDDFPKPTIAALNGLAY